MGFPNNLSFVHEDQMYEGGNLCIRVTGIKSNEFHRQKWPKSEGCEFKSGKGFEIF